MHNAHRAEKREDEAKKVILMKSIQTELAEGQTASSLQTFHEKETAAEEMHDERKPSWLVKKRLTLSQNAFSRVKLVEFQQQRAAAQQQRRIFDFTPWLTRSL